jgi:hypothetical protein
MGVFQNNGLSRGLVSQSRWASREKTFAGEITRFLETRVSASHLVDEPTLRKTVSRLTCSKTCDWESAGRIWPYLNLKWAMARL